MALVGEAEITIVANTAAFDAQLAAATDAAGADLSASAAVAGEDAGGALRTGVAKETDHLGEDLGSAGLLAGGSLKTGVETGAEDVLGTTEKDVAESTGRMTGVMNDFGSKAKSSLSGLGVPASLLSGPAVAGIAFAAIGAGAVDLGVKMQKLDAAIATSEGISVKAATGIGNAFLATAGQSKFSGQDMATAFGQVAGQLKSVEGHALDTGSSMTFMNSAVDLATAKNVDLNTATGALAATMQAFQIPVKQTADAANVLFNASNATGQGIDTLGAALDKVKTKLGGMAPPLGQMGGLLVDMANHGETGRASMQALSTTFTTLLKPAADAAKAQIDLNVATKDLPTSLRPLAAAYADGTIHGTALTKITDGLSSTQKTLFDAFTKATDAAKTQDVAQQTLGVTVTNAQGKFVGMSSVIDQLQKKIVGQTTAQATATLTALGFGSSASKLVSIIQAGPKAFDDATASVTKLNSAHNAAQIQAKTLGDQFDVLKASLTDFGTQLGQILLPILADLMGILVKLVPVVGVLLKGAFDVLKPIIDAVGGGVKLLADAFTNFKAPIEIIAGIFTATLIPAVVLWGAKSIASAAEAVGSFVTTSASAALNAGKTVLSIGTEDTAVVGLGTTIEGTDTAIIGANEAAGASFTAMLGPIAAVAAAGAGAYLITTKLLHALPSGAQSGLVNVLSFGLANKEAEATYKATQAKTGGKYLAKDEAILKDQGTAGDRGRISAFGDGVAKALKDATDKKIKAPDLLAGVKPLSAPETGTTSTKAATAVKKAQTDLTSEILKALTLPANEAAQSLRDLGVPANKAAQVLKDAVEPFQEAVKALEKEGLSAADAVKIAEAGQKMTAAATKASATAAAKAATAASNLSGITVNGIQVSGAVYDAAIGSAYKAQTGMTLGSGAPSPSTPSTYGAIGAPTASPTPPTIQIAPGAVVINPAPGNDAVSLLATKSMVDEAIKALTIELQGGVNQLGAVVG